VDSRSSLCAWRRKQRRLANRPLCLKCRWWTESKKVDSFSASYSIFKACAVERKCLFLLWCVCAFLGGGAGEGETIGTKGANFEVTSFNIIVKKWQNMLHYCQYVTEHVTLLTVCDRTRYIIVMMWQNTLHYCHDVTTRYIIVMMWHNTLHYCHDVTEHATLLSWCDRTGYIIVMMWQHVTLLSWCDNTLHYCHDVTEHATLLSW